MQEFRAMIQEAALREPFSEVADLQSRLRTIDAKAVSLDADFLGSVSNIALGNISIEVLRVSGAAASR
jgi:hypothetical protein